MKVLGSANVIDDRLAKSARLRLQNYVVIWNSLSTLQVQWKYENKKSTMQKPVSKKKKNLQCIRNVYFNLREKNIQKKKRLYMKSCVVILMYVYYLYQLNSF